MTDRLLLGRAIRHEHDVVARPAARAADRRGARLRRAPSRRASRRRCPSSRATRSRTPAAARVDIRHRGHARPAGPDDRGVRQRARDCATSTRSCPGAYRSHTGMGLGIVGARRLMDHFDRRVDGLGHDHHRQEAAAAPREAARRRTAAIGLAAGRSDAPSGRTADRGGAAAEPGAAPRRSTSCARGRRSSSASNRELEDTNRGVVALYAELDERADHLRRADELKTRFLSNMTHEFRTPGELDPGADEPARRTAGRRVPSRRTSCSTSASRRSSCPTSWTTCSISRRSKPARSRCGRRRSRSARLFGALRGMLRPLLRQPVAGAGVRGAGRRAADLLGREQGLADPAQLHLERAEVHGAAARCASRRGSTPARDAVDFAVADTGIGIPEQDLARVFDEFVQIENPLQRRVKGTGLGLPLSKRLAELLGGTHRASASTLGVGSTFSVTIPLVYRDPLQVDAAPIAVDPGRVPVLVVEDSDEDLLLYERALAGTRFQVVPRAFGGRGRRGPRRRCGRRRSCSTSGCRGRRPGICSRGSSATSARASIPVIVVLDDRRSAEGFRARRRRLRRQADRRAWLLETLDRSWRRRGRRCASSPSTTKRRRASSSASCSTIPSTSWSRPRPGVEGLRLAHEAPPDVILLDLRLTDMTGIDVFDRLRQDPTTARVPVIVVTSQRLSDGRPAALVGGRRRCSRNRP